MRFVVRFRVGMETDSVREVATLAGPRMPADRGLAGLGLVMQLFGSIFLGVMALVAMLPLFDPSQTSALIIVGVLGALRATFHRMAGTALLDTTPPADARGPYRAVVVYAAVAAAQTLLTLLVLLDQNDISFAMAAVGAAALMAWPTTLLVVLHRPRFRALVTTRVPSSEDLGFESAAVLMTLLGFIGAGFGAMVLSTVFQVGDELGSVEGILGVAVMGALLVRSILHARAGLRGTSGIDSDHASDSAARYYTFGVVSAVVVGAVLLVQVMMQRMHPADLMLVGVVIYLLMVWPLLLRRFFTERNFSALLGGAHGPSYRRAPDGGLIALGWMLLATGLVLLSVAVWDVLFGSELNLVQWLLTGVATSSDGNPLAATARSPFWLVGVALAQLWAASELIAMSDRYRAAATVYGAIASVVVLYLAWPVLALLEHFGALAGPDGLRLCVQLAWLLVLPLGTLLLAHRSLTPVARARLRVTPPSPAQ